MKVNGLREAIKTLGKLPVIKTGMIAKDNQIIEGNDGGAHFKITKEELLPLPGFPVVYLLSVSGNLIERRRLILFFVEILGETFSQFKLSTLPGISFVSWIAATIDKKKK